MQNSTTTKPVSETINRKRGDSTMNKANRYGFRPLGKGALVSNDTRRTHLNNNDLVVGTTGASKTGSLVYPQLKSLKDSSLIVVDTKGRLSSMFTKELRAKGYREFKSGGDWYFGGISFEENPYKNSLPDGFVEVDEPLPFM